MKKFQILTKVCTLGKTVTLLIIIKLPLTVPNKVYKAIWLYRIALPNICNAVIILNDHRIENEMLYNNQRWQQPTEWKISLELFMIAELLLFFPIFIYSLKKLNRTHWFLDRALWKLICPRSIVNFYICNQVHNGQDCLDIQ